MIRKSLIALVVCGDGMAAACGMDAVQEQKPEAKKWDVADPTGPTTALAFDTNEGTWMNVDVSPDGTQVVFDLLGDIYLMPIAGSAAPARRLTSGPAFDMQPRFSPDGKRIAHRQRPRRAVEHLDDRSSTARTPSRSRASGAGS